MSLKHAILGLLTIQPMTGYDLKHHAFDTAIAHFWQADQAQIYRTLDSMETDGWVSSQAEIQTDRPNKRIYSITPTGHTELLRWLNNPQRPPVYREPFLVQMFFAGMLNRDVVLDHIKHHLTIHQELLQRYQHIELPNQDDPALSHSQTFWRMTLELGMAIEQTYVDWLARCQAIVEDHSDNSGDE